MTSTESGLSVPDWPLSYGQWFPPMVGGIRFEHSHRMIAGIVGLLTLVVAVLFWRLEERASVRNLALAAFLAVIVQAVLGGITVRYFLPKPISVAHACLGQIFFCMVSALALVSSRQWIEGAPRPADQPGHLRAFWSAAAAAVFVQLILGAWVRHTGTGVVIHIVWALAVIVLGILAAAAVEGAIGHFRFLTFSGRFYLSCTVIQILLGVGAFVTTHDPKRGSLPRLGEILFTTAHQAVGVLVLMAAVLASITAFARLRSKSAG